MPVDLDCAIRHPVGSVLSLALEDGVALSVVALAEDEAAAQAVALIEALLGAALAA